MKGLRLYSEKLKMLRKTLYTLLMAGTTALVSYGCGGATDEPNLRNLYDVTPRVERKIEKEKKSIVFIIDTSGSMRDKLEGVRKIDSAKKSLLSILDIYKVHHNRNQNIEAGLICFSGNGAERLVSVNEFNYDLLAAKIQGMKTGGNTPLGISLALAERDLNSNGTGEKYIVLLTDGMSNIGKTPEEVYKIIRETNINSGEMPTRLFVIPFNTERSYFKRLEESGANVNEAGNEAELLKVLQQSTALILEAPIDSKTFDEAVEKKSRKP